MRQVPAFDTGPLGIVGDGRVARHFLHYLNLLGLSVCAWSRRAPAPGPTQALGSCGIILILIRSLTGPLSRGDAETIDGNLKALDGDPFHAIHHAFARLHEQRS